MKLSNLRWWENDFYYIDTLIPAALEPLAGPKGLAYAEVYAGDKTQPGWGLADASGGNRVFSRVYRTRGFDPKRAAYKYTKFNTPYALITRSARVLVVDIDGKNGGLEHAQRLGALPPTLAETSKSGNGYHLFYSTNESWEDETGFSDFGDAIGIEQGVDIRSVGCVFHYPAQRWNDRTVAPLPDHLANAMKSRKQKRIAAASRLQAALTTGDPMDVLVEQDNIITKLAKPIADGKRNNTLFAIGQELKAAGVKDWGDRIRVRAEEVGLEADEIEKLVGNIDRY